MKKRKRPDASRTRCEVCGHKNERRLETCFYCGKPIYHGVLNYWLRKIKRFFRLKGD